MGAMLGGIGACFFQPTAPDRPSDSGVDSAGSVDPVPNLAFVTSASYSLGGKTVTELDAMCQSAGGSSSFVAWYGTPNRTAMDRLGSASGWIRKDGKPLANTPAELASGHLLYPLTVDEGSNELSGQAYVATATRGDGSATYAGATYDCTSGGTQQMYGVADAQLGAWTNGGSLPCSNPFHLYCLQTEHTSSVSVPAPPSGALHAFLLAAPTKAGSGLSGLDGACEVEATTHGLAAIALVSTSTFAARSRLVPAREYYRADGVMVFDGSARRIAPIDMTWNGVFTLGNAWAGSTDLGSAGAAGDTCTDWTDAGSNARAGDVSRSLDAAFGALSNAFNCGIPQQLFCVEQ